VILDSILIHLPEYKLFKQIQVLVDHSHIYILNLYPEYLALISAQLSTILMEIACDLFFKSLQ
jgi:ethanolamine utilization microcompartment shell protein EutS